MMNVSVRLPCNVSFKSTSTLSLLSNLMALIIYDVIHVPQYNITVLHLQEILQEISRQVVTLFFSESYVIGCDIVAFELVAR
jgi:hypothetical protein